MTEVQSNILLQPYDAQEVREALFTMHLNKSPGPDGFNPEFYQVH